MFFWNKLPFKELNLSSIVSISYVSQLKNNLLGEVFRFEICVDFRNSQLTLEMELTRTEIIILLVSILLHQGISLLLITNNNSLHKMLLEMLSDRGCASTLWKHDLSSVQSHMKLLKH